jgi:hypothetical protein
LSSKDAQEQKLNIYFWDNYTSHVTISF